MPPKLPNLKYKPRLVRQKNEVETGAETEELTLVQLERLRLQQEAVLDQQQQQQQQQRQAHAPGGPLSAKSILPASAPTTSPTGKALHQKPASVVKLSATAAVIAAERAGRGLCAAAERFPANTMPKILEAVADNPTMTLYYPTPLESTLPARLKTGAEDEPVEGDDQRPESTVEDGLMFLKEYEEELRRSHEANLRFNREVLQASVDGMEMDSFEHAKDGDLVWFQLPRFQGELPFVLSQLPPGKVGEVKVYKSGRMVMEICGVHYDLSVEGYTSCNDGGCNVVTAVLPPTHAQSDKAGCYQLGLLEKKIVCTPCITEDM